jgi:hypothetical protein
VLVNRAPLLFIMQSSTRSNLFVGDCDDRAWIVRNLLVGKARELATAGNAAVALLRAEKRRCDLLVVYDLLSKVQQPA